MQRLQMSGSSSSSISRQQQLSEVPQINGPYQHFSPNSFSLEAGKSSGNSPSHNPPSPISPSPSGSHNLYSVPCHHSHSLSQPTFFFSLDSLPPLSPPPPHHHHQKSTPASSLSGSTEAGDGCPPPRKLHRRSKSEIPSGFLQSPPPPPMAAVSPQPLESGKKVSNWVQDAEGIRERKSKDEVGDDLFHEYMNLDSLETLNSSEDRRGSGRNEKEGDSSGSIQLKIPISTALHHCTSVSMDSLMGKLHFGDESPKLPPFSACRASQHSRGNSMDGTSNAFTSELQNGEFSSAEVEKIMANEKLAEIALTDPMRAKRILANRQSAARSKERNLRYISELERKVQTLQIEATTLSAQLTLLQRDSAGLTSQNNELNFRLQAMEQHAQLRDALNEALTAEVQHLKLATANVGDAHPSHCSTQQISINPQMFQLQQQQQSTHRSFHQLQHQEQQQQNNVVIKNE